MGDTPNPEGGRGQGEGGVDAAIALAPTTQSPFWVFGYGSLMWRPGFPYLDVRPARVSGYHRALCIFSTRYRGTPERPGLVVGLDRGGSCLGRAYLIATAEVEAVIAYLEGREMVNRVYEPRHLKARLDDGRRITAYGFVARRDHKNYCGKLALEETAALILQGEGEQGSGLEYLRNTVAHLDELGIRESVLHRALDMAEARARQTEPVIAAKAGL